MAKRISLYIALILVLTGCRPKGILHSWEMRSLLYDLHRTDALLVISGAQHENTGVRNIYYAEVLEKHGVTQAQFDSSLVWYTAHPQLFDKIYPKVVARLKADEEAFVAANEEALNSTIREEGLEVRGLEVRGSALTKAQLDSTVWVTTHGWPSSWNPLMHDLEDQLFPQIPILR
jgi:hypothetical protein